MAVNSGKRWTEQEENQLSTLWLHRGYSIKMICDALGRDVGGITSRLGRLGLLMDFMGYEIQASDTAEDLAKRNRSTSAVINTNMEQNMMHTNNKILRALNMQFGGWFTLTTKGWFKTYDELPVGWKVITAHGVAEVVEQRKTCPRDMMDERIDYLLPIDQRASIKELRDREEAAGILLQNALEDERTRQENAELCEEFGADKMEFVKQIMKSQRILDNLENTVKAYTAMAGDDEVAKALQIMSELNSLIDSYGSKKED